MTNLVLSDQVAAMVHLKSITKRLKTHLDNHVASLTIFILLQLYLLLCIMLWLLFILLFFSSLFCRSLWTIASAKYHNHFHQTKFFHQAKLC